jgi:hypothetical protein
VALGVSYPASLCLRSIANGFSFAAGGTLRKVLRMLGPKVQSWHWLVLIGLKVSKELYEPRNGAGLFGAI